MARTYYSFIANCIISWERSHVWNTGVAQLFLPDRISELLHSLQADPGLWITSTCVSVAQSLFPDYIPDLLRGSAFTTQFTNLTGNHLFNTNTFEMFVWHNHFSQNVSKTIGFITLQYVIFIKVFVVRGSGWTSLWLPRQDSVGWTFFS